MPEFILSLLLILTVVLLARVGAFFGAFYEITSTLLLLVAVTVALRYWYPLTRWVVSWWPGGGSYAAFGSYWALFLVGCLPLIIIMDRITQDAVPRYPKAIDVGLGFIFGAISGIVLVCCVMTSLSVVIPKLWEPYDRTTLLLPFDEMPIQAYQEVERDWLHIPANDPSHTRFPTYRKEDADDINK